MKGKAGPKPGPVMTKEEKEAAKAKKAADAKAVKDAKAKEREDAKAAKAKEAEDAKAKKETEKAEKAAAKAAKDSETTRIGDLSDDQQRALFVHHLTKIEALKKEVASISGTLRAAYKIAKAEGYAKKDIDFAIRLRTIDDTEVIEERRREQKLAQWINHPLGTQPDLFNHGDGLDRTPDVDRAFEDGKLAGLEGKVCQPPHHFQTEQSDHWVRGWHEGQKLMILDKIKEGPVLIKAADSNQGSFDDVLPEADGFETPVPDHAKDPTSKLHPQNAAV